MPAAFATLSCALAAAPSLADPIAHAMLGITLCPVIGRHVEPGGTTNFDGTPLVTVEGSARYGAAEGSLADRNRGVAFTLGALARAGDASP